MNALDREDPVDALVEVAKASAAMPRTAEPSRNPEQLDRSTYLGSSDAAAILGVSKWSTPLDIYRRKVDPESFPEHDAARLKIFRRGHLLEPVIRTFAVEDYGLDLVASNARHHDPVYDWMRAEIDFETRDPDGSIVNNDCKSVSPFAADQWGEDGTDEIPIEYHAQFQFGMMVTNRDRCDVWALFGTDKLVKYVVHRDDEAIAGMRSRCVQFWQEHVLPRVPPSPVSLEDIEFVMRRLQGRRVLANPDVMEAVANYRACKADIKAHEEAAEEFRLVILEALVKGAEEQDGKPLGEGEDAALIDPQTLKPLITWKAQETSRIDVTALRERAPLVAASYTKTTTSRVLRLSKAK